MDDANEWVQIGRDDTCVQYSHVHSEGPEWGTNGIGNEEITRNILCCTKQEFASDPNAKPAQQVSGPNAKPAQQVLDPSATPAQEVIKDALLYNGAMSTYHPHLYDRSKSWYGQTYEEGLDFCGNIEGYELCSYGMSSRAPFMFSCF